MFRSLVNFRIFEKLNCVPVIQGGFRKSGQSTPTAGGLPNARLRRFALADRQGLKPRPTIGAGAATRSKSKKNSAGTHGTYLAATPCPFVHFAAIYRPPAQP